MRFRWEADMMQQMLVTQGIEARVIDLGTSVYLGTGSPAALQVRPSDRWTALLLLSDPEGSS